MFEQSVRLFYEGIGNINYGSPGGGAAGGVPFGGADDGTSLGPANQTRLGNPAGSVSALGKLLDNREIFLNAFSFDFQTNNTAGGGFLYFAPPPDAMLLFDPRLSNQQPITLLTVQGKNPPPLAPYGNFQIGWLEQSFVNPDGQIDAVMSIGYNTDGGDGQLNPNEASFATVLESHFVDGSGDKNFEWYLTASSYTGIVNRYMFLAASKINGSASMEWKFDQVAMFSVTQAGDRQYFQINDTGAAQIVGPAGGPGGALGIATDDPLHDGALLFQTVGGGGFGQFNIVEASGNAFGYVNFQSAILFTAGKKAAGYSPFYFQVTTPTAADRGWIFLNNTANAGLETVTFWNNNNTSFAGNNFFGAIQSGPTAKVHCGAGTAAAGTGPLKLSDSAGGLLTVPEDGCFEYDTGVLYYTVGAVRKIVTLI